MDETTRVRAHLQNIEHYQNLLKTKLSEIEQQFVERRLSEERFAIGPAGWPRCTTDAI